MKLSIIVPIYKVEQYVHTCLESIFRQGLEDDIFEVILINDGTPDKSMEVIQDIIESHKNIRVINQENQGLSMSRNNGLKIAHGDYILFVDSDDLLIYNTVPFLLNKAISSKADLVVADFQKMTNEQITQFLKEPFVKGDGKTEEKNGEQLFLQDLNPHYCCVWRTLYRRDFLNKNNIRFVPNIYFEDVPFTHECYLKANQCLRVFWPFIIYRNGNESITSSFNLKKGMDYCTIIGKLWVRSHDEILKDQIKQKIQNHVFVYFSMLFYALTASTTIPRSDKVYLLNYLKEQVPDLSFKNGYKQRIVSFLYKRMPSFYMALRIIFAKYFNRLFWNIRHIILHKQN